MFCGKCGRQIPETSKFCEYCGASLLPETDSGAGKGKQTRPQRRGKRTVSFKIVCVLGVFLLLAAGGIWVFKSQSDSKPKKAEVVKEITDHQAQESVELESTEESSPSAHTEEGEALAESAGEEAGEEMAEETELAQMPDGEETEPLQNTGADEFLLPDSAVRLYTDEELLELSAEELRLARNELYARHGRIFQTEDLNGYFSSKTWYEPRYTAEQMNAMGDAFLNEFERANRDRIVQAESANKGERNLRVVNCQESITLRWEPYTEAEEICQIPLGEIVTYTGMGEGMFYQIEYDGLSGYALSTYFAEVE